MQRDNRSIAALIAILIAGASWGAYAAGGGGPGVGYVAPYKMEPVEGNDDLVRITLEQSAIDRLGIETAEVTEETANRTFVIGGDIIAQPPQAHVISVAEQTDATASGADPSATWIALTISEDIEDSSGLPVRVRTLNGGDAGSGIEAMPDMSLNEDVDAEEGGKLYYRIASDAAELKMGHRVLVEVPYHGNGKSHKVIPYSAILYDQEGDEWVYVNPEPSVYLRAEIDVAYIEGDKVFLSEGPDVGTKVVTVGAAELYGTELKIGH
jgi:hypothetical protein